MTQANFDPEEVAKFNQLSTHWWDPHGELRTLHDINPLRLKYIDDKAQLAGKSVLDIGCGGGILAESMSKIGANVTGIDMSEEAIKVAQLHQYESGTTANYLVMTAEELARKQLHSFDIVTCMELLEHVPDPSSIVQSAAQLVKPGGHVFFSTLNRTMKAYLFAIVGAEYLLKLIPKNTHDYAKFIRPSELSQWMRNAGLTVDDISGISYNPMTKEGKISKDVSVNYLMHAIK